MEEKYRVKTNVKDRALTGLSMGKLQTIYAGIKNTGILNLGVFSSAWFANNTELSNPKYAFMKADKQEINANLSRFFIFTGGKEDIAYQNCQVSCNNLCWNRCHRTLLYREVLSKQP